MSADGTRYDLPELGRTRCTECGDRLQRGGNTAFACYCVGARVKELEARIKALEARLQPEEDVT